VRWEEGEMERRMGEEEVGVVSGFEFLNGTCRVRQMAVRLVGHGFRVCMTRPTSKSHTNALCPRRKW